MIGVMISLIRVRLSGLVLSEKLALFAAIRSLALEATRKIHMVSESDIFLSIELFLVVFIEASVSMIISIQSGIVGFMIALVAYTGEKYKESLRHGVGVLFLGNMFSQANNFTPRGPTIDHEYALALGIFSAVIMSSFFVASVAWCFGEMIRYILTKGSRS